MDTLIHPTDIQLASVFAKLDRMQAGELLSVKDAAPNLPELFIECCKKYIDCYHTAEFNFNYTTLKKILPCKSL